MTMGSRRCSICELSKRALIDAALTNPDLSTRQVAKRFGLVARTADRHKRVCLGELIRATHAADNGNANGFVQPAAIRAIGSDLVERVEELQSVTLDILERARTAA
jgi:hypothetical protein